MHDENIQFEFKYFFLNAWKDTEFSDADYNEPSGISCQVSNTKTLFIIDDY